MRPLKKKSRKRMWQLAAGSASILLLVVILWMDIAGSFWQETVILSGIAAGLLTFVLTAAFVERWMADREHQKWVPVTRLALADILHSLADDELSDIRRGQYQVRTLRIPDEPSLASYDALLHKIVEERNQLTDALARWSPFLVSSADVQDLMIHIAQVAETLDDARDAIIEAERSDVSAEESQALVERELKDFNASATLVVAELASILADMSKVQD